MSWSIGATYKDPFETKSNGTPTNADSTPVVHLYINGVQSTAATVTNTGTGIYSVSVSLAGLTLGDACQVQGSAIIGSVPYSVTFAPFQIARSISNRVDVGSIEGGDAAEFLSDSLPTVSQIRQEIDANSTQLSAIVQDTDELQSNQGNWLTADVSDLLTSSAYTFSLPANFGSMEINASGQVTTSNPASGGGSAHTAEDVRNLILGGDQTPIITASGQVESSNMRGNDDALPASSYTAPNNAAIEAARDAAQAAINLLGHLTQGTDAASQFTPNALAHAPSAEVSVDGDGLATADQAGLILAKLSKTNINVVNPQFDPGAEALLIVQGDAYLESNNNRIELALQDVRLNADPSSDGSRVFLKLYMLDDEENATEFEGNFIVWDSTSRTFAAAFELTASQTSSLTESASGWRYDVDVWPTGDEQSLITSAVSRPASVASNA